MPKAKKVREEFGAQIIIMETATLSPAPSKIEFVSRHKCVLVGIGKDHTAELYLDEEALVALREMKKKKKVLICE
jgi:hypothetical protein